jgi:hypothetical protein
MAIRSKPSTSNGPALVETWQFDLDEREFKWSREDGAMPGCLDVQELLCSQDTRMKEITYMARTSEAAYHLLLATAEAHRIPMFSRREAADLAHDLVAEGLTLRFGRLFTQYETEVEIDEDSRLTLMLRGIDLDVLDGSVEEQATKLQGLLNEAAEEIEAELSKEGCLTPDLRRLNLADPETKRLTANWSAFTANRKISDCLSDADRRLGALHIAESARKRAYVDTSNSDAEAISFAIPLGIAGYQNANPVIAATCVAALAVLVDSLIGGREMEGRSFHSVQVRGTCGCAIKYVRDSPCTSH